MLPDERATEPEENQLREAYALASEATRTLQEARAAVKKVRQARGYYAPESMTGKGISGSPTSGTGKSGSSLGAGRGKGKPRGFGPCFICGKYTHGYAQCPDRSSKGKSKGKLK